MTHGLDMIDAGADVIDVGGESSRPGAEPVPVDVELERVVPVVEALAAAAGRSERGVRLSVDTVKPEVALAALAAGASLVNDISASLWEVAAAAGAGWVAMHMRGQPRTMQDDAAVRGRGRGGPIVPARAGRPGPAGRGARGLGRPGHRVRQDDGPQPVAAAPPGRPGGGRGRCRLRRGPGRGQPQALPRAAGRGPGSEEPAPVADRIEGSLATAAAALVAGVGMVRVHDVAATVQMTRLYGPAA